MIGVDVRVSDRAAVEEFFELFKTPWEYAVSGRRYRTVLSTTGATDRLSADHFLIYRSDECAMDRAARVRRTPLTGPSVVTALGTTMPLYGAACMFADAPRNGAIAAPGGPVDFRQAEPSSIWRIGYDLFSEVGRLLRDGQPVAHAASPTLDRHIELLRHLLLESGVTFLEIPPRPSGHEFICCLTHDVDFFGIRRHRFDKTLAGFVMRASVGSLTDWLRGRRPAAEAIQNLAALASLPLIHLGLRSDFWRPFDDYAKAERSLPSTFFLVPFADRPGVAPDGRVEPTRGVPYGVREIAAEAQAAVRRGSELGVHGIDAWRDAAAGRAELAELTAVTGQREAGVRMHWLYFDGRSPQQLQAAGFTYDSTWGYNETVGYRAGTSQVFNMAGAILELTMSIMYSALFSGRRMKLTTAAALGLCEPILEHARKAGGTVVINWHERSLAPERLWGRAYAQLLNTIAGTSAWFATAAQTVEWFQWRRSIQFSASAEPSGVRVSAPFPGRLPGVIRVYRPSPAGTQVTESPFQSPVFIPFDLHDGPTHLRAASGRVH
jgi:hypothetical protein